jgi:hypothetical protein
MKRAAARKARDPLARGRTQDQREVARTDVRRRDTTTPTSHTQVQIKRPLPAAPTGEVTSVMWREGAWRCDFCNVPGRPVFRLYDGDTLELEQCVQPHNFVAIADLLREAVWRFLVANGPRRRSE